MTLTKEGEQLLNEQVPSPINCILNAWVGLQLAAARQEDKKDKELAEKTDSE